MTAVTEIVQAWSGFYAATHFAPPQSEEDYETLHSLANYLVDHCNVDTEPYDSLFALVTGLMHTWELEHEPELKNPEVPPFAMLAHLMEQQNVTQYQLGKEGVVDQGNLSAILRGKRGIGLTLAKRLAERFKVSVEVFI